MNTLLRLAGGALAILAATTPGSAQARLVSEWDRMPNRIWVGPRFWANRLQDWSVREGYLECLEERKSPLRTVHALTHRLGSGEGGFAAAIEFGPADGSPADSACGLLLGAGGDAMDPRGAALIARWRGEGQGYWAGVSGDGRLFLLDLQSDPVATPPLDPGSEAPVSPADWLTGARLDVRAVPAGDRYRLELRLSDAGGARRASLDREVPAQRLVGNVALVSHPGGAGGGRWRFSRFVLEGKKVTYHPERTFGPVVTTQYTLSGGVLKLCAQLTPVGPRENDAVTLEVLDGEVWRSVAQTKIAVPGWTAAFRIPDWDGSRDWRYRVIYLADERGAPALFEGIVRAEPRDDTFVLAALSCNHNRAHGFGREREKGDGGGWADWSSELWFPHTDLTERLVQHEPDLYFFAGDQLYEGASPTGVDRANLELDYLYKWYLWCWAYRDLTRSTPTVTIPDDHDVYQGNLWGQGGRATPGRDHHGGYVHPASFVRMVERTQTSHLPDPYDATPVDQSIGVYYSPLTYGGVGFAIVEDRKFKSGCAREDMPASGTGRPDHFNDPEFDTRELDREDAPLLGERQLAFLSDWVRDWRGQHAKVLLSQTVFANLATHHGADLKRLLADLDSNGWPQTGRRRALEVLRKGFALHVAGDQHLATLIRHGLDAHGDAIFSFCMPAIANFYPRAWSPNEFGKFQPVPAQEITGDFLDGFGNRVTMYAATNPDPTIEREPTKLHRSMPGYGIVRIDKQAQRYTIECWPRYADPASDAQYEGWPKTIELGDNYSREPLAWLAPIEVRGCERPVVQLEQEPNGELVYARRFDGATLLLPVYEPGTYRLRVGDPEADQWKTLEGLQGGAREGRAAVVVEF